MYSIFCLHATGNEIWHFGGQVIGINGIRNTNSEMFLDISKKHTEHSIGDIPTDGLILQQDFEGL